MNDNTKTMIFVGIAVLAALIAWASLPSTPESTSEDLRGRELFPEFDNPLDAASLEIVEFDESTATVRPFKVAQVDDQWSIPSHDNYPADAQNQLADVAAGLVGIKALDMPSDTLGDHALYGVVEPDPKKLKPGDTGVGTRLEIRNREDKILLSLIIGKEVPDREGLRYVRVGDKEGFKVPVYTAALKTDKLSTKFEKWIEKDLLKLGTYRVGQVEINDYSVDILAGRRTPRSRMTLEYDDKESKWKLIRDRVFTEQGWEDMKPADDPKLNTTNLNAMKSAIEDLKIVDVAQKPEGLSENLRDTGEVRADSEAFQSLADRGFYIVPIQDHYELLSSEGEVFVLMKDGVQYVLRFGQVTGSTAGESAGSEENEATDEDKDSGGGLNRYLFVMAELNRASIPKPDLKPLPTLEETPEAAAAEAGTPDDQTPPAEAPAAEAQTPQAEDPAAQTSTQEDPASEEAGESESQADKDAKKKEIEEERQRIEKENQREQDQYDEKIEKAKERVRELNGRFANWYYVISDDVYRKIHLSREDVIQKEETPEGEGTEGDNAEGAPATGSTEPSADQPAEAAGQPEEDGTTPADFEKLKQEGLDSSEE